MSENNILTSLVGPQEICCIHAFYVTVFKNLGKYIIMSFKNDNKEVDLHHKDHNLCKMFDHLVYVTDRFSIAKILCILIALIKAFVESPAFLTFTSNYIQSCWRLLTDHFKKYYPVAILGFEYHHISGYVKTLLRWSNNDEQIRTLLIDLKLLP